MEPLIADKLSFIDEISGYPAYSFIRHFLNKGHVHANIYSFREYNLKEIINHIRKNYQLEEVIGLDEDQIIDGSAVVMSGKNVSFMFARTDLAIYSNSLEEFSKFQNFIKRYSKNPEKKITELYKFYSTRGYVLETDSSQPIYKKVYPTLYPDIDIDALTTTFLDSNESVLILYGDPGVGKTSFVKYMYSMGILDRVFILQSLELALKPDAINDFPESHGNTSKDLLFLDDVDILLAPRDIKSDEKNSLILSTFLSMTDSICIPPKVILTTNVNIKEIDAALIRPGRCFDFIHIKPMTFDYALSIIPEFGLSEDIFRKRFTKTTEPVYQSHFMELVEHNKSNNRLNYYRNLADNIPVSIKLDSLNIRVKDMSQREKTKLTFVK